MDKIRGTKRELRLKAWSEMYGQHRESIKISANGIVAELPQNISSELIAAIIRGLLYKRLDNGAFQ